MDTSFQNAAGLFWPTGTPAEAGRDSSALQPRTAVDLFVDALSQIVAKPSGMESKSSDEKPAGTLFDANGAPQLASPDEPSTPPLVAPSPLNLGYLVGEAQKLSKEANAAQVNGESNRINEQMQAHVDKIMDAKMNSIQEFEKKSSELAEKAGTWYNQLVGWVSENLGPYMPYIGVAVATVATIATGGAAWPMLAMAGLGLANHVLQKCDVHVIESVSKAIKAVGSVVSEKGADGLANMVGSILGVILSDPTPISKLFGTIAKAVGASKATIEKAEQWGQIFGMIVIVGANIAMTWGGGAANAVTKAASSAGNAAGSAASNVTKFVSDTLKSFLHAIEPYVSKLLQILRDSSGRFTELSALFKDVMQAARTTTVGSLRGAATTLKDTAVAWQPRLDVGAKVGQSALNATNGLMGVGNGWQEFELSKAQYAVDITGADRRKLEQLLAISRDNVQDADEGTRRAMDRVGQNLKSDADMIKNYTHDLVDRAAIQSEQMTA